ncbi:amino acid ABC transporter substrate-binding protein [Stappia stellulata]|uniref:amino acid ABC transporter substrate-binding protein n=1 Tax=Stappia stellulata TaxID=71235 RepID=UPI001CD70E86|nr:amino acid ABC transporter substrate-binding protein [Stappia stellulata]MCA1241478.1 amino acid ABC transporter substrate-binding protein [Stappia stellulata]
MSILRKATLALAMVSIGALASADITMAQEPIKIGMTVSQTGRFALAAQSGERGLQIWLDDVNARGGIEVGGEKRPVELVALDDRSDKALVPRVYETLIKEEGVDILFGPFGSTLTGAAANTTEQFDKFLMIWSASADSIYAQGYRNVVSGTQLAASLLGLPTIKAMHANGVKSVAIAYLDEPFPAGIAKGQQAWAEANGIEVTMVESFSTGTKDYSILIQKALASGAQAFIPTSYEGDQMIIARQLRELDANFDAVGMFYGAQPQFLEIGEDAEFLFSQTLINPKVNWDVTAGLTRAEMMERYEALFPDAAYEPDFQTALAYGAGVVLEEVIKAADSTDPAEMKQAAIDLSGNLTVMTGPYAIEETGKQVSMEFVVMQNQGEGNLEVIFPPAVATADPVFPAPAYSDR